MELHFCGRGRGRTGSVSVARRLGGGLRGRQAPLCTCCMQQQQEPSLWQGCTWHLPLFVHTWPFLSRHAQTLHGDAPPVRQVPAAEQVDARGVCRW